ncbi:hypothetical protein KZX62_00260 [Paenibacillus silvae]|nr:hypothetical protein [Paenibacillus silvae]MCK6147653.1 hypothetical protein [Paenibacillus silvae]
MHTVTTPEFTIVVQAPFLHSGEFVFMANIWDTMRGDFSRVFTCLDLE